MRKLFIAAAALAAFPATAQAQSAATPLDHSGLRVEGIVGYDALTSGEDSDGVVYGGAVGYDFPAGGVTLGADAELTDSSIKGTEGNVLAAGDSAQVRLGRDIYVGGRVGFPISRSRSCASLKAPNHFQYSSGLPRYSSAHERRSAPTQNAWPAPVRTIARTSGSAARVRNTGK